MLANMNVIRRGAGIGIVGGMYCGLLAEAMLVINNPMFVENIFDGLLFFLILPAVFGGLWGAIGAIPLSLLYSRSDYHWIKQTLLFIHFMAPVLVFGGVVGTSFFILMTNKFLTVGEAGFLGLLLVMSIVLPLLGFAFLRYLTKRFTMLVAACIVILLWVSPGIGLVGSISPSRGYGYSRTVRGKDKMIVIAVGGATWKIMNPLLRKKKLPNIAWLMGNGSYGTLRSLEDMDSAVTWASGATGGLPETHGISSAKYTSRSYRMEPFWELAERYGMSIGVFGYPTTWPPKQVNGYMIPGWDALDGETFPSKFAFLKELERLEKQGGKRNTWQYVQFLVLAIKNGLRLETIIDSFVYIAQGQIDNLQFMDRNYKAHLLKLGLSSDIFTYLYNKYSPDLSVYYNGAPDGVAHYYWRFYEPEKFTDLMENMDSENYSIAIPMIYQKLDQTIGKILQEVDENTTVVIFSNHGDKASPNNHRNRMYYLLNTENLLKMLDLSNEVSATRKFLVEHLLVSSRRKEDLIKVIDRLRALKIEGKKHQKLIDVLQVDEELGVITVTVNAKSVVTGEESVNFRNKRVKAKKLVERSRITYSAVHDPNGIIIIRGASIKKGYKIKNASLLDVAPTLLAILGLRSETAADGRILAEIFNNKDLAKH